MKEAIKASWWPMVGNCIGVRNSAFVVASKRIGTYPLCSTALL